MLNVEITELENGLQYDVEFKNSVRGSEITGDSRVTVKADRIHIQEVIMRSNRTRDVIDRVIESETDVLLRNIMSDGLHHLNLQTYCLQKEEEEKIKQFNRYFDAPESFIMKEGK